MAPAKFHISNLLFLIFWELLLLLAPSSLINASSISEFNNCFAGEESTNKIFTCAVKNEPGSNVVWKKHNLGVSFCTTDRETINCTDNFEQLYKTTWSNGTSIFTIKNISIGSEGNYSCNLPSAQPIKCDFKIYAKPENITCQVAQIGEIVTYTCEITKVYPVPKCLFIRTTNNSLVPSIVKNIETPINISGYYTGNCSLTLPVNESSFGLHQMTVTAFPSITGNDTSDSVLGKNFSLALPLNISRPTVTLNCPTNYVLENSNFSCTCSETSNSFLSVNTSFYEGTVLKTHGHGIVQYTFIAKQNMPAIICSAKLFNIASSVSYEAPVAYGPTDDAINLTHSHMEKNLDICDKTKPLNVIVNCTVSNTSVSPGIHFNISVNKTIITSNMSYYSFDISTGGDTLLQCTGINSAFPNISGTNGIYLKSFEPPQFSPVMQTIQANTDVKLKEGTASIMCKAEGGYPLVSNVTVECGSQKNISQGNVGYLELQVNREMDGSNCTCTGNHVSSCTWNNTILSKLDVYFDPRVTSLKVNGKEGNYNVKLNSNVSFSCLSEGNPSPNVSLIKNNMQLNNTSGNEKKFNLSLSFTKNMTDCKDTGIYICWAGGSYKNVTVSVNCSQQLANPLQQLIYSAFVQDKIDITIDVYGYPKPYKFTLSGSNFDISDQNYEAYYEEKEPPYGTVSLTIFTKSQQVFQNYTLDILNGEGSLPFKFQILDKGDRKKDTDVAAIVGGVVAGVVAFVVIAVIIIFLKRKGIKKSHDKSHRTRLSNETSEFDNSEIYNINRNPNEVEFDNTDIYNMQSNSSVDKPQKCSEYKKYTDVITTVTTASAAPKNMKNSVKIGDPYEDLNENDKKIETIAMPPKPATKPKTSNQLVKNDKTKVRNTGRTDETYSMVAVDKKSAKPITVCDKEEKEPYSNTSEPEVPEKKYEKEDNSMDFKKQKAPLNPNPDYHNVIQEMNEIPESTIYINNGFSHFENDTDLYANVTA